jgi:stage V sporulation protein G
MFVIKNIKLIEGNKGLFIAMPSRKISPEKKVDICNPLNQETRKMFEEAIIDKYNS